jgi:hypothetical protein
MIKLFFSIVNPRKKENFKSLWEWSKSLTKNKHIELQLYKYSYYLLEFEVDLNWSGNDHAGPEIHIGIFRLHFRVKIYDSRHWDHHTNSWVKYGENNE